MSIVCIPAKNVPIGTIIFFNGLYQNANKEMKIDSILKEDLQFQYLKVIYPFPLKHVRRQKPKISSDGIYYFRKEATEYINQYKKIAEHFIEIEINNGIPQNKIIIGGFSIGGAIALHASYNWFSNFAGTFALSSFLSPDSCIYEKLRNYRNTSSMFMAHGDKDNIISLKWSEDTFKHFQQFGVNGEFHTLENTKHEIVKSEVILLKNWIFNILPNIK